MAAIFWMLITGPAFADNPVRPRIILQTGHASVITAAAWTSDSRFIVTGGLDRQLLLWNLAGEIVDRAVLPPVGSGEIEIQSLKVSPDGKSVRLVALFTSDEGPRSPLTADWTFGAAALDHLQFGGRINHSFEAPWPVSPDGRFLLDGGARGNVEGPLARILTVRPAQAPGRKVALVGASVLSDPALDYLAGTLTADKLAAQDLSAAQGALRRMTAPRRTAADDRLDGLRVSPDGRLIARLARGVGPDADARLQVFDMAHGAYVASIALSADYDRLAWLDAGSLIVSSDLTSAPMAWVDVGAQRVTRTGPALCHAALLDDDGTVVGAGADSCRPPRCKNIVAAQRTGGPEAGCAAAFALARKQGLWIVDRQGGWREAPIHGLPLEPWTAELSKADRRALKPRQVTALAAANPGGLIAVGLSSSQETPRPGEPPSTATVAILTAAGRLVTILQPKGYGDNEGEFIGRLAFAAGGRVLLTRNGAFPDSVATTAWDVTTGKSLKPFTDGTVSQSDDSGKVVEKPAFVEAFNTALDVRGETLAIQDSAGRTYRFDIASAGKLGPPIDLPPQPRTFGFAPQAPLLWSQVGEDEFHLQRQDSGAELFTLYLLPDAGFFAIDGEGRYDTNLSPDSRALRWLMADEPFQSLAPQTFMRENYQPGLMRRLLDCAGSADEGCRQPFPAVRPLAQVNRLLPRVSILSVQPKTGSSNVVVTVEAEEAVDAGRARRRSGLRDLRLFRDGKLVAQWPEGGAGDLTCGRPCHSFTVDLPTTGEPVTFQAYAFNDDRVKGETARFTFTPATPPKPRPRRAYVVTIGVNAYPGVPGKDLSFAANDARAVAEALRTLAPVDEVVETPLLAEVGRPSQAAKADIQALFAVLATGDRGARSRLRAAGVDTRRLERVTPDDVVILSFAGHGWADKGGGFYLLPSDARQNVDGSPALETLISSAELSDWLRPLDAGEMALIIDACHSAASVATPSFKPGPMGDPGLGQLSFDKGMRILAATQSDDVALEDAGVGHGLLTYALAQEGVTPGGGKADLDADGRIMLDEWLRYATGRLPALSDDVRVSRISGPAASRGGFIFADRAQAPKARPQEPSLFDFAGRPSQVVLRKLVK